MLDICTYNFVFNKLIKNLKSFVEVSLFLENKKKTKNKKNLKQKNIKSLSNNIRTYISNKFVGERNVVWECNPYPYIDVLLVDLLPKVGSNF